jgi:hypothetical protein
MFVLVECNPGGIRLEISWATKGKRLLFAELNPHERIAGVEPVTF